MTSDDLGQQSSMPSPDATTTVSNSAPVPRKRRRRTAGGGAQDDCFACRKRAVPCDRKRPYCTQCIDIGKECSGYKTTLTWGVGVASRGKLRGLSYPVSKTNGDGSEANADTVEATRRKSSASHARRGSTTVSSHPGDPGVQLPLPCQLPSARSIFTTSNPYLDRQAQDGWQSMGFQAHSLPASIEGVRYRASANPSLQRLHTALGPQFDGSGFPNSASSTASFGETDFQSPSDFPHPPTSLPFEHGYQPRLPQSFFDHPTSAASMSAINASSASAISYMQPVGSDAEGVRNFACAAGTNPSQTDFSTSFDPLFFEDQLANLPEDEDGATTGNLSVIDTRFGHPLFGLPSRLQSLISYYEINICPFLVAFDGPKNPYRMHIINLASQNEGLQNAIAALATNNMRMRRKEARQAGYVEELGDAFGGDSSDGAEPSAEETCYKQMSIDQLNMQLTDPSAAQDDSVLATLLILCLFHVCDSGFSKFKTQLAGVQKLLALRDPQKQSSFTGWVKMFFMWFDVMTSAVNDRETQIRGDSLDMLDFSANLGALEQFSGCDGRLFKLIARLGRLSLLAQGRPVSADTEGLGAPSTPMPVPTPRPFPAAPRLPTWRRNGTAKSLNRSLDAMDYDFVDGNGWGTPIISSDDDATAVDEDADDLQSSLDEREDFWGEWRDIRCRLKSWRMETSTIPSPSPARSVAAGATQLDPEQRDLVHISESFRHSAILYTERLAHPLLPSSAAEIQRHVSKALYHITALPVTSCVNKFLLWPLFVTGTECVDAGHRAVVRTRCIEIQRESGFFNNLSGLEVLERVWRDADMGKGDEVEVHARRRDSEVVRGGHCRQAFRWRRAMDRVDGEYIII